MDDRPVRGIWIHHSGGGPAEPFGSGPWFVGLLVRWVINAIGLLLAAGIVPGIELHGWESTLITAALFGLVNAFIRPFVLFITCLFQVLTLGLFTLIVNTAMLGLTAWAAGQLDLEFAIDGFWAAFAGALVISLVSFILTQFAPSPSASR